MTFCDNSFSDFVLTAWKLNSGREVEQWKESWTVKAKVEQWKESWTVKGKLNSESKSWTLKGIIISNYNKS